MNRITRHIALTLNLLIVLPAGIRAQQANTLYFMHHVPQSNLLNPAVMISCKYHVGIPVLSSLYADYGNTAFSYEDLDAGTTWNTEALAAQVHRSDLYRVEADWHLLSLGYRRGTWYFNLNVAERVRGFATLPGELIRLAVEGNYPGAGNEVKLDGLRPGAIHTREYALGIAKILGPYLTGGVRARLLFGKAGLNPGQSRLRALTGEDNFELSYDAAYRLNASFPMTIEQDADGEITGISVEEIDPYGYLLNRRNPGFAMDMGLLYDYSERITLAASLLDLGFIRWRSDVNNIDGEGIFRYSTLDFGSGLNAGLFSDLSDSLASSINYEVSQEPFTTMLPLQLYLGASYRYNEHLMLGFVNRNVFYRSKWNSSYSFSASTTLKESFSASASWSYLNNSLKNIGIGLAWHGKGLQLHAATDNILGFFYPFNTRTLNLRFGVNLMLGCPRDKKERLQQESLGRLPRGGECPFAEDPDKIRKKRERAVRRSNRSMK